MMTNEFSEIGPAGPIFLYTQFMINKCMYGVVYLTVNRENGKWYIGQHKGSLEGYLGSGILLTKAIAKYGPNKFKQFILEECTDREQLKLSEKSWINFTNAVSCPMSYNIAKGGDGGDTYSGMSEEAKLQKRQRLSLARQNSTYKHSDETKQKIRKSRALQIDPRLGKKNSDETKAKIKAARAKQVFSIATRLKKRHLTHADWINIKRLRGEGKLIKEISIILNLKVPVVAKWAQRNWMEN